MKKPGAGGMLMLEWIKEGWKKYKEGWSNWWHFKFLAYFKLWKHLKDVGPEQWIEDWNGTKIVTEPEVIPFALLEKNI